MNQSPEQVEKRRKEFERAYRYVGGCGSLDRDTIGAYNIVPEHAWQIYLRARNEQDTEIAALKTEIAELMPLAKFGAMVSRDKSIGSIDKREILQYAILADVITPNIKATIDKLLKD